MNDEMKRDAIQDICAVFAARVKKNMGRIMRRMGILFVVLALLLGTCVISASATNLQLSSGQKKWIDPGDHIGVLGGVQPGPQPRPQPTFTPTTCYIDYFSNGGGGAPSRQTCTYGGSITISSVTPTREGYTFLGWSKSKTATTASYFPNETVTLNTNMNLYALWREKTITGITLSQTAAEVKIGRTTRITAVLTPSDAPHKPDVIWTSSNGNVASVSQSGIITGVSAGSATITATTSNGLSAACRVTVSPVVAERIVLNHNEMTLKQYESCTLTATVLPIDTTDKTLRWVSSDPDNLPITNGQLTAKRDGAYTVTVYSESAPTIRAVCRVTVSVNPDKLVPINESTFPDPVLRQYVLEKRDKDGNNYLSEFEISLADYLFLDDMPISDLTGIEYFTELDFLDCSNTSLVSINLSHLPKLEDVFLSDCERLSSITISDCESLNYLNFSDSKVTLIDIVNCPGLVTLSCENCLLTTLELVGCPKLEALFCNDCSQLASLDLSGCVSLQNLDCSNCDLAYLNVAASPKLETLYCENNHLTELDVSGLSKLERLYLENNPIAILDLTGNPALAFLGCRGTELMTLDITPCPALMEAFLDGQFHTTAYSVTYRCDEDPSKPWGDMLCMLDLAIDIQVYAGEGTQFGLVDLTLPEKLATIGESAFEGIDAHTVEIPEGCRSIGANAFRNSQLEQIRIPGDCEVDETAFDGCAKVAIFAKGDSPACEVARKRENCRFVAEGGTALHPTSDDEAVTEA